MTWFKNKNELKKSERTKMEMHAETGVCTLEITDATTDDSGEYAVQLDNDVINRRLFNQMLLQYAISIKSI